MRPETAAVLMCLILIGTSTEGYTFSLHTLHKFGKKHLKALHKTGLFTALHFRPHIFLIPHEEPQLRKVAVVPIAEASHHRPVYHRVPKIMQGIDPARLAMDWPYSVTPGGPGPEWW